MRGDRTLNSQRAITGTRGIYGVGDLCADWEIDEIETGMNPYRPPSRPPVNEWCDIEVDDEVMAWAGFHLSSSCISQLSPPPAPVISPPVEPSPTWRVSARFVFRDGVCPWDPSWRDEPPIDRERYGTWEDGI